MKAKIGADDRAFQNMRNYIHTHLIQVHDVPRGDLLDLSLTSLMNFHLKEHDWDEDD